MGATSMTKPYAVLLLACLVLLGACSRDEPPAAQAPANEPEDTALGKVAEKVRTKLEHANITLSRSAAEAHASIHPQADLLTGGTTVATNKPHTPQPHASPATTLAAHEPRDTNQRNRTA